MIIGKIKVRPIPRRKKKWVVEWREGKGLKDIHRRRFFVKEGNALNFADILEKGELPPIRQSTPLEITEEKTFLERVVPRGVLTRFLKKIK